jgi:hypothetical protein
MTVSRFRRYPLLQVRSSHARPFALKKPGSDEPRVQRRSRDALAGMRDAEARGLRREVPSPLNDALILRGSPTQVPSYDRLEL